MTTMWSSVAANSELLMGFFDYFIESHAFVSSATTPDSPPFTLCVPPSCTYAGPGAPAKLGTGVEARQFQWRFFHTISCTASS